jgi:hypothetical protein
VIEIDVAQGDSTGFSAIRPQSKPWHVNNASNMSITTNQPPITTDSCFQAQTPWLFSVEVSFRIWVPAGSGARFLSRHRISDAAGSLISLRLQPARYAFAMGFPRPVTRIFVPPLETPAACHVRLAATTLKPYENFVEYRIRLSLPYILRSTPLLAQQAKKHAACQSDFIREAADVVRAQVT